MRYVCLVHVDPSLIDAATPEQLAAMDRDNQQANAELTASGHLILDLALKGPETARIVRSRGGKVSATDGPYIESKEHLGGFFVIEARDIEEAVAIARREPMARFGSIEVRAEMGISWQQPVASRLPPD
ncbi:MULTISPECIES: YciI family protein [unclassified Devosia]|uniref:YciI family protein n=1 Tax=unclassified Devosia TaxID=196773 RepID=UPI00086B85C7|nr:MULTISPECIES: YciI family protein [unclassified Devosia]MBN9363103.1 YciI family protein [Devosia sp.]ODS87384.1 MAG: hypothetical protein ABS47_12115 [Devosia sp. SCN 66-27]OJX23398.1 MAG: hypothetical protein BGO83_00505 [Devosia sp. 66-14]